MRVGTQHSDHGYPPHAASDVRTGHNADGVQRARGPLTLSEPSSTVRCMHSQTSNTPAHRFTTASWWPRPFAPEPRALPWDAMEAAYTAMLDYLAPAGPEDEMSIDERRGAMKGAVAGGRAARTQFAAAAARRVAETPEDALLLRRAIELWQWAYRRAVRNARTGHLVVHSDPDGERFSVTEPFSGIGAAFYPNTDRHIDSSGGAKGSPTALHGHVAGDYFGRAEHFIGVGIGRWVYLRGAHLVAPQARWPIVSGLRPGSGSPQLRAWLHAQDPCRWQPVHDSAGNISCSRCAGDTAAGTRAAWEALTADAKPQDHPLALPV